MMKIKHSKFRNTGLIFELLVKQVASDTLNRKDSPAVNIIKKYFSNNSTLAKEFKLYEFLTKNSKVSQSKGEAIISTITEISKRLDRNILKKQKYNLISDIKEHYNIDEFFAIQVKNYKPLASLYCLLEAQNSDTLIDPEFIVNNKASIVEHLTSKKQDKDNIKDTLIEEYSKYDKDLRLLTFKILLEKFNQNYRDFLPEQKSILKEFITSVNSQKKLLNLVIEETTKIKQQVELLSERVKDDVTKIKLQEVYKMITIPSNKGKITDDSLVRLMQYYDLVNELKQV